MKGEILVSIWCITYNHEKYIKDAIEGFLMQKTNFKYEIVIHDDASTDKTAEIIREYENKYPDLIHAIYEKENKFSKNLTGFKWVNDILIQNCKGKYIAACEGDDYWIDCYKLQIQVEYMQSYSQCSMCVHNGIKWNSQDGTLNVIDPYDGNYEKDLSAEEVIMQYKGHPPTASMLYRKELMEMPDFFNRAPVGDYTKQLYYLTKGKIHYSSRIMSVYRWCGNGSYTQKLQSNKKMQFYFNIGMLHFLIQYNIFTEYRYHVWLISKIQRYVSELMEVVDSDTSYEEYYEMCRKEGYYLAIESEKYLVGLGCLRKQMFDMDYCSDTVKRYTECYDNIVIMGKGRFGTMVAKQFERNGIRFEGFAVSQKKENEDIFMDKPVWELCKLPYDKENTGIVIAINPIQWDEILYSLEKAKIKHYICPFLFYTALN